MESLAATNYNPDGLSEASTFAMEVIVSEEAESDHPHVNDINVEFPAAKTLADDVTAENHFPAKIDDIIGKDGFPAKKKRPGGGGGGMAEDRFQCTHCGKLCASNYKLNEHRRTHTGEKPFKCGHCPKAFAQKKALLDHEELHSQQGFPCPICRIVWNQRNQMLRHFRKVHHNPPAGGSDAKNSSPSLSASSANRGGSRIKDVDHGGSKSSRPGRKGHYECETCHKVCPSNYKLTEHIRIHTGETPFKCHVCNKGFRQKKNFLDHQELHSDVAYSCPKCDSVWNQRTQLIRHLKKAHQISSKDEFVGAKETSSRSCSNSVTQDAQKVTPVESSTAAAAGNMDSQRNAAAEPVVDRHPGDAEEDAYKCSMCEKVCVSLAKLYAHLKSHHTRSGQFRCNICQKSFVNRKALDGHKGDHNLEGFPCPICGDIFKKRIHILWHLRIVHKIFSRAETENEDQSQHCDAATNTSGGGTGTSELLVKTFSDPCVENAKNNAVDVETDHQGPPGSEKEEEATSKVRRRKRKKNKYECEFCGKICVSRYKLLRHVVMHTGEKPFRCDLCDKRFGQKKALTDHQELHQKGGFPCPVCHVVFKQKVQTARHVRKSHAAEAKAGVVIAYSESATMTSDSTADSSWGRMEEEEVEVRAQGPQVESGNQNGGVDETAGGSARPVGWDSGGHLASVEKNADGRYKCDRCSKSCVSRSKLMAHYRTHTGERPFKCDICDKTFTHEKSLQDHKDLHSGIGFPCPVCSVTWNQKSQMQRHLRKAHKVMSRSTNREVNPSHAKTSNGATSGPGVTFADDSIVLNESISSEKGCPRFKCSFCNEECASDDKLEQHLRTHSNEGPFKCHNCSMEFSRKKALDTHLELHLDATLACPLCGVSWSQRCQMLRHMKKAHGETHPEPEELSRTTATDEEPIEEEETIEKTITFIVDDNNCLIPAPICELPQDQNRAKAAGMAEVVVGMNDYNGDDDPTLQEEEEEEYAFECTYCDSVLHDRDSFEAHVLGHSTTIAEEVSSSSPCVCNICKKSFVSEDERNLHYKIHSDSCFACPICSKIFYQKSQILTHIAAEHETESSSNSSLEYAELNLKREIYEAIDRESVHEKIKVQHDCHMCGKILVINSELSVHLTANNNVVKPFQCETCGKSIEVNRRCNKSTMNCRNCKDIYSLNSSLIKHKEFHDFLVFPCPVCGLVLNQRKGLIMHMKETHLMVKMSSDGSSSMRKSTRQPFPIGQKYDKQKSTILLDVDSTDITGEDSMAEQVVFQNTLEPECRDCGSRFPDRLAFWGHAKQHFTGEMFVCQACPTVVSSRADWDAHCDLHASYVHSCDLCGRSFTSDEDMTRHKYLSHLKRARKPTYICRECGSVLPSAKSLEIHERAHKSGQSMIYCRMCGKAFLRSNAFHAHVEKFHANKATASQSETIQSASIASGKKSKKAKPENSHKCNICGKIFGFKCRLEDHMNRHTGNKPYKCSHCPKTFTSAIYLYMHQDIHNDKKYPCSVCGRIWNTRDLLNKHRRKMHRNDPKPVEVQG